MTALVVLGTAASAAPTAGTKGSPQPELARFKVGVTGAAGTGAVLADGTLVLASPSKSGTNIDVCMLHPGDRSCAATSALKAYPRDSLSAPAEVVATGGKNVSVVTGDGFYVGADGLFVYNSSNDGKTFSTYKKAGTAGGGYGIGGATYAGSKIVVVASAPHVGIEVQAFSPSASSPVTQMAVLSSAQGGVAIGTYRGGVLVAFDNLTTTSVEYAKAGSNFGLKSSYKKVLTIPNEQTVGVSGSALLTDVSGSITGFNHIRWFNGTSFGSAFRVAQPANYDDGYFSVQQTGATTHVFYLDRRAGYDVFEASTTNGAHWTGPTEYQTAIQSSDLAPVLGPSGAGLVFEADGTALWAQPILNGQLVKISVTSLRVPLGHPTTINGKAAPHLTNQLVTLQKLSGGLWYNVSTTREDSAGKFAFTVPGATVTYRAVVNYEPGYYEYGYSNSVSLTAITT
jgi:hypothetical protein